MHWDSATNAWIRSKCLAYRCQYPHEQTRPSTEHGPQNHTWRNEERINSYNAETSWSEVLDSRRNAKLLTHGEKVKRMPDHPLHKHLQDLTKNRLKRTSLNNVLKEQQRKHSDILAPRPEECEMFTHNRTPLVLKAEVIFSIPGMSTKSSDSEAALKTLTLAVLDKNYPATAWTQVFTDGSAENASSNGGCGIYIRQPNKPPITIAIPGGDMCSNYRAEAQALLTATETVTQL